MRIIFPTDENRGYLSKRGAHFGKAKFYTIVTLDENKIAEVESLENPGHSGGACGSAIENILSMHPDALVVSGIGSSPAKGFANAGLDLYFDQSSPTVQDSIAMIVEGRLQKSSGQGTCGTH